MDKNKSVFLKEWKKQQRNTLIKLYPHLTEEEINKTLDEMIDESLIDPKCELHNNYVHKSVGTTLLGIYDWLDKAKPIIAGYGTFFKNQHEAANPAAVMIDKFLTLRKKFKGRLKDFHEESYEYKTFDRLQGTEKINVNSFYGASGAPTSVFYNIYTASSCTSTGQSLISTTMTSFEAFLADNVAFLNLDDCITYMENICKEKYKIDDSFLPPVDSRELLKILKRKFVGGRCKPEYEDIIEKYVAALTPKQIQHIYYKNNVYRFSMVPKIYNKLVKIIERVETFKDPNEVPEEVSEELNDLWDYYRQFVLYNYPAFDRIGRLRKHARKSVVVVDTDSNMINLDPWVKFIDSKITSVNPIVADKDPDELNYISINIMCFLLTQMIRDVLAKYTKRINIPKEFRHRLNMKNEFLFSRIILASKKKKYITSVKLREGKIIDPEKVDIKGMDFIKSTTREDTKKYFTKIIKEKLLYTDKIDIGGLLRELEGFEDLVRESLSKGEKNFLIPASVKEVGAYKDASRIQGFKAVVAWNYIYPNQSITLPDKIDIIKVKMDKLEYIEKLEKSEPEIYKNLVENIFESEDEKKAKKGVTVIAIPRNIPSIPAWMMDYIDYETIINDNISRFYAVLDSLGIELIAASSKRSYFSNILKI